MGDFCPGLPDRDRTATGPRLDRDREHGTSGTLGKEREVVVILYLVFHADDSLIGIRRSQLQEGEEAQTIRVGEHDLYIRTDSMAQPARGGGWFQPGRGGGMVPTTAGRGGGMAPTSSGWGDWLQPVRGQLSWILLRGQTLPGKLVRSGTPPVGGALHRGLRVGERHPLLDLMNAQTPSPPPPPGVRDESSLTGPSRGYVPATISGEYGCGRGPGAGCTMKEERKASDRTRAWSAPL
eukprot:gene21176-biopygen23620